MKKNIPLIFSVIALIITIILFLKDIKRDHTVHSLDNPNSTDSALAIQQTINSIATCSIPTVVRIDVTRTAQTGGSAASQTLSFGSGVIIEKINIFYYILTNEHVIKDSQSVTVTLFNDKVFDAEIVGLDPRSDVGLIRINSRELLACATTGNSDRVAVGDWAICLGNPMGFNGSLSLGVISARSRSMFQRDFATEFIQTDAAVNPGNSGGPLLNIKGEIIGITSWIATQSGGNTGLSFAIPINTAMMVYRELKSKGYVEYAWLGVLVSSLKDPQFRRSVNETRQQGAYITEMMNNSPASESGLEVGNVIVGIDNYPVTDANELVWTISKYRPGDTVRVRVARNNREEAVTVRLGVRPNGNTQVMNNSNSSSSSRSSSSNSSLQILGAVLIPLDQQTIRRFSIPPDKTGYSVQRIITGSPADSYGIRTGDIIYKINDHRLNSTDAVNRVIAESEANTELFYFYLLRSGVDYTIGVAKE